MTKDFCQTVPRFANSNINFVPPPIQNPRQINKQNSSFAENNQHRLPHTQVVNTNDDMPLTSYHFEPNSDNDTRVQRIRTTNSFSGSHMVNPGNPMMS